MSKKRWIFLSLKLLINTNLQSILAVNNNNNNNNNNIIIIIIIIIIIKQLYLFHLLTLKEIEMIDNKKNSKFYKITNSMMQRY